MYPKLMRGLKVLASSVVLLTFVVGCATSQKIAPVQIGDNQLSKDQLAAEIAKLDEAQRNVDANKGVTGTNVAAFLLWWPGLAYTYYDASEATRLIEQRRSHLTSLYNQKMTMQGKQRVTTNRNI